MEQYLVVSRNGNGAGVSYPEGTFPTVEAAVKAARSLRDSFPHTSRVVRDGWYTRIEVVETDGVAILPPVYQL